MYNQLMYSFLAKIAIDRPPEVVFEYLNRYEAIPEWANGITKVQVVSPDQGGKGTRITETVKMGAYEKQVEWEVTQYEPHERVQFRGESFIGPSTVEYRLTNLNGSTQLAAEVNGEMVGLARLFQPLLRAFFLWGRKQNLAEIKNILEKR